MLGQSEIDLNFLLESVNGVILLQSACLLTVLMIYLLTEAKRFRLTWWQAIKHPPIGMTLAAALVVQETGVMLLRGAIFSWRRFGSGETMSMNHTEHLVLLVGTFLSAAGLLWLTRILSSPLFGDWPWLITAVLSTIYIFTAVTLHYYF